MFSLLTICSKYQTDINSKWKWPHIYLNEINAKLWATKLAEVVMILPCSVNLITLTWYGIKGGSETLQGELRQVEVVTCKFPRQTPSICICHREPNPAKLNFLMFITVGWVENLINTIPLPASLVYFDKPPTSEFICLDIYCTWLPCWLRITYCNISGSWRGQSKSF